MIPAGTGRVAGFAARASAAVRETVRPIPRALHPVAWWIWALSLAVAVSRTGNPLLLLLVVAVLVFVVANRRTDAPWARAFKYYLYFGLTIIALRVVFRAVFTSGVVIGEHILFRLPHVTAPAWYDGVQFGGPVTIEAVLSAAVDGLRLATLICCIGAANALANPRRALRVLPGALYELGVAVVVAISVAPQLVESVQRVARARKLRGGSAKGFRVLRSIVIPVLEDALERSLRLAAAMNSRGYGRVGRATPGSRHLTAGLLIAGLVGICAGFYGLLDATAPGWLGVPTILVAGVLCLLGLVLGGRRVTRSRYRPDPWRGPEFVVCLCGLFPAVVFCFGLGCSWTELNPSFYPLSWPSLPLLPTIAVLVAALAGIASPPPLRRPSAPTVRTHRPAGDVRPLVGAGR